MHLITLLFLIFLSACNSQDAWQSNTTLKDNSPLNNTAQLKRASPEVKYLQSKGIASEQLVIRWPRVEPANPFSNDPVNYEIWHNDIHIDTVATNSYQLPVSFNESKLQYKQNYGCVRLRAVKRDQQSELSEPTCYAVYR